MEKRKLGLALCGSYCTYERVLGIVPELREKWDIYPIMSEAAAGTDTRFGTAEEHKRALEELCGHRVIETIAEAEPIGPKKLFDVLAVAPCTGNTLAKLAAGVNDTAVTMAVKAHLRNLRPVVIGVSTNDGLSASAKNIGELMNRKAYYFIPFGQDDPEKKPNSLAAKFEQTEKVLEAAMEGKQLQPVLT